MAKKEVNHLYVVIVAIVAVVAIVTLVLSSNGILQGAPVVYVGEEDYNQVCVDTDFPNDRYAKGSAQIGVAKYYDYCKGDTLFQYECGTHANIVPNPRALDCENGCENGACLQ